MMKRIIGIFLCVVTVFLMLPVPAVRAIPSSGNVVQQMGGPVSSKFSLKIDDIVERYSGWQTYEARFYPFGEGEGMPVFIGTAHHVQQIKKTDAEIAYLDAMEKAGTDEYSLKKFHEYVQKYEATCQTSAEVLSETIYDVSKTALSAAGFVVGDIVGDAVGTVAGEAAGHVVGAASLATGVWDNSESLAENGVNADVIASIGFTLGDLAGLAGGILGVSALAMVGTVAAVGGIGYTMFQKHMEHQEQWKDFANYLMGRRNLTEFFKYLEAELLEKMKDTSGWDIQFNNAESTYDNAWLLDKSLKVPISMTLTARFMHNYVPEFEFGQVSNPDEDGWAGNLQMYMEADFGQFMLDYPHSEAIGFPIDVLDDIEWLAFGIIDKNEMNYITPLMWHSSLNCFNFPLKTKDLYGKQAQIVFTGDLSTGNYNYRQSGEAIRDVDISQGVIYEDGGRYIAQNFKHYRKLLITQEVVHVTGNTTHYVTSAYTDSIDYDDVKARGDAFFIEIMLRNAKMIIDTTKTPGGERS